MRYEFKVGDKGKTRGGDDYEVIAIVADNDVPVVAALGASGKKRFFSFKPCGTKYPGAFDGPLDLIPPEPQSRDCYLWVGPCGTLSLLDGLDDVASVDETYHGRTKAIKPLTIRDGEGLGLLEAWRDERAKKAAPEPLWPGRVVYDLGCVTNASRIEADLRSEWVLSYCGFAWSDTPQGGEWWSDRYNKTLSDETRAALEDLLAQYRFENGERYEIGDWVSDREKLVKSIDEHDCLIDAFGWASTPEGQNYWGSIRRNGHDWQSRVKLKVMLLSIAAHDAAGRDDLGDGE